MEVKEGHKKDPKLRKVSRQPVPYEEEAGDEKELKEASENWKMEIIKNLATRHNF